MARTSNIRIQVQVDRLPDVDDGAKFVQLGLRVSAVIEPTKGSDEGAIAGDEDRILPWRWRDKAAPAKPWNAHANTSWKIWRQRKGSSTLDPDPIPDAHVSVLKRDDAGYATFEVDKFRTRVDEDVADIVRRVGYRQALEVPVQDGVLSGRTAYGLAESLTALPNPVPVAMNVWTAVWIDQAKLAAFDADDRFVAVPLFAVADAAYEPDGAFSGGTDGVWAAGVKDTPSTAESLKARAVVHSSLPLSTLGIGNSKERMIDAARLLIRARGKQQFESGDWIGAAGLRIAEAIDPAARAMSVLDSTIDEFVRVAPEARRKALRDDMIQGGPDLLRAALRKLHEPVIAARAQRSDAAAAPAAAFLEGIADRAPERWPAIVPMLFAQAGAESGKTLPPLPPFHVTSCSRILGAAGVPPSPELVLADAASAATPLLDSPAGFVDWMLAHWLARPQAAAPATEILFDGHLRALTRGDTTKVTELTPIASGVVSFARVSRPAADIVIPIRLTPPAAPAKVTVTFQTRGARAGASAAVVLDFLAGNQVRVEVAGFPPKTFATPARALLSFIVRLPDLAAEPSLQIAFKADDTPAETLATISSAALVLSGPVSIAIDSAKPLLASIDSSGLSVPVVDRDPLIRQAQTLRGALSWAYASPFVPALLQGWAPLPGHTVPQIEEKPLDERLRFAADAFIETWFRERFDEAKAGLTGHLADLFDLLRLRAVDDAKSLIETVVPPALEEADRVTEDAQPLAFMIAQLQDFDPLEDLWGRLAGVGVLISRHPEVTAKKWWSLNAATLHVTENGVARLDETTAVRTATQDGGKWQIASKVDPVPLSVGDVGGTRSALVKYENHSIVGELEGSPRVAGSGATVRRPEAFFFPTQNFTRMPALTFGRTYSILPYLIGHGGALPLPLRKSPLNPVVPVKIEANENDSFVIGDVPTPGDAKYVHVRETRYLRTVPVSAPRVAEAQWPGTFPGVDPLADELPLRPPPVTVAAGGEARFFVDKERLTGLLTARGPAIAIDIPQIVVPKNSANAKLRIRVAARGAANPALVVTVEVAKLTSEAAGAPFGLRIEAATKDHTAVKVLIRREHLHADDGPDVRPLTAVVEQQRDGDVASWKDVYIAVSAIDAPLDVEPPAIRWGELGKDSELVPGGDRPLLPPELAHATRKVAVLDGIRVGAQSGPKRMALTLRRPSAPLATYERWINGPTGKYGSADDAAIRKALKVARDRSVTPGSGDRSLDDPAVETLFVEVVQLFPRRVVRTIEVDGAERTLAQIKTPVGGKLDTIVAVDGNFATLTADVLTSRLPDAAEDARSVGKADPSRGTLALTLAPGCTYEIRVYGAVPSAQPLLAPDLCADRFSRAVRASWRDVRDDAGAVLWRLGTPLTLTVEVATEIMPECWPRQVADATKPDFTRPLFAVQVQRPPRVVEDRAAVSLVPEHLGPPIVDRVRRADLTYAASRYVNRAALMPQRWSWRGRPLPELVVDADATFGTEARPIGRRLGDFVDAAFFGRADDDIGTIREVAFGRAHVAGGEAVMGIADTRARRPVLLEHDLDRRAGTNLWRFALRLTSRYAAMRPNHPDLLRFSHLQKEASRAQWWPVVVPDRVHPERAPRGVARPGLMLVVPLTETEMTAGSVPPLLAVFNQELFPQFNAADGIESVIDVVRHPLPGSERVPEAKKGELRAASDAVAAARGTLTVAEAALAKSVALDSKESAAAQRKAIEARESARKGLEDAEKTLRGVLGEAVPGRPVNPFTKYYQQVAPDPVRAADPAADRPVAVRVDGPVGYTFDAGVEAGRFDHSALLVSPVAEQIRPGSFVRLRFRRLESPRLLVATDAPPTSPDVPAPLVEPLAAIPVAGARFLLENPSGKAVVPGVHLFRTAYEGLAFDVPDLRALGRAAMRFRFALPEGTAISCADETRPHTTFEAKIEGSGDARSVIVSASTHLGSSATWSLALPADARVRVQAIVSLRPRPIDPDEKKEKKKFAPVGDVSLRVRIERGERDSLRRPEENAWLSVLCMPLTTSEEFTDLVAVQVCPLAPQPLPVEIAPLRLSDFTPPVWCQFAAVMSRFLVEAATNAPRTIEDVLDVDAITVQLAEAEETFTLSLRGLREGEALTSMTLRPVGEPDQESQLEEPLYAVVTRYVHDAFDRLRERAIGIHPVVGKSMKLAPRVWPAPELREPYSKEMQGRIRFLRVLRGKARAQGGFEREPQEFPKHFFGRESDEALDAEPLDAAGMAIGISRPIDWRG